MTLAKILRTPTVVSDYIKLFDAVALNVLFVESEIKVETKNIFLCVTPQTDVK